MYNQNQEQVC
uniref:Uncharacterized protein n=1 Tax=Anguilla anguilla TaxID=7936 RepID=A0A0E9VX15_ANGAN